MTTGCGLQFQMQLTQGHETRHIYHKVDSTKMEEVSYEDPPDFLLCHHFLPTYGNLGFFLNFPPFSHIVNEDLNVPDSVKVYTKQLTWT